MELGEAALRILCAKTLIEWAVSTVFDSFSCITPRLETSNEACNVTAHTPALQPALL